LPINKFIDELQVIILLCKWKNNRYSRGNVEYGMGTMYDTIVIDRNGWYIKDDSIDEPGMMNMET